MWTALSIIGGVAIGVVAVVLGFAYAMRDWRLYR
jgi:hypothetical protein